MRNLSLDQVKRAGQYLKANCRPLEQARFDFLFGKANPGRILEELRHFQNSDGGFGHGLEADFLLPDSSPLATSVAFQIMNEIPYPDENMVSRAVQYLESAFDRDRHGWYAVSEAVNDYPHAAWWNWDKGTRQTVIDHSWGNPSAELIGYLSQYRKFVTALDVDGLVEHAAVYWEGRHDFPSEHEVYCIIRLYEHLPPEQAKRLEPKLIEATQKLVVFDPGKWKAYTPQPVHFAESPNSFLYGTVREGVEANLDYLISSVSDQGVWSPNWTWGQYEDAWPKSKASWEGMLTVRNLKVLAAYGRIEK